jgi:small-conductance mechanosensitive channel
LKYLARLCLILLSLGFATSNAPGSDEVPEEPAVTQGRSAEAIVAGMSDEQVRRLLMEELKKQALAEEKSTEKDQAGRLAVFIEEIRNKIVLVQERIEFLKNGEIEDRQRVTGIFNYLAEGQTDFNPMHAIASVLTLFVAAFAVELIFRWYSKPFRGRIPWETPAAFLDKIGRLLLKTVIDLISTLIFIAGVVLFYHLFFERTQALRMLVATYLSAIVAVKLTLIISRFFLSPRDPSARFLPMTTATARYLYRWVAAISIFASFGLLTCGIIRLAGSSEAAHIKAVFMISLIIAAMLVIMVLQKRKELAAALSAKFPTGSLQAKLMQKWHHFAVFSIFLILIFSTSDMLLGNLEKYSALKTLGMIPLYFFMDWAIRQILELLFGVLPEEAEDTSATQSTPDDEIKRGLDEVHPMKQIIISSLRGALVVLFLIWNLNIWGMELPIGKAVAQAVFNSLIVVLLCYVVWTFLNTAIERRLRVEMPEEDQDLEEGGAGGSRIGTLLLLLRKFLTIFILVIAVMVILSTMGVNIGPMVAGAGVVGLAIGFGAQTLVKDIISGIFFLVDDAFRVGDYIQIGTTKGMVEVLSLRSIKLRHPRGMVNTIPFGDIATVTNYSRDYIITKLDFRVRYDTDVEKVRKVIKKKVYKPILKNDELAPKLLGKIKSQGVRQMDDSAMIMRIKYKTKPGDQFAIRKEVYRLLQEAFREEGIEFAHKNVTVYMPPEISQSSSTSENASHQKIMQAGAAAVDEEQAPQVAQKNL